MQKQYLKVLVPALGLIVTACGGGSDNNIAGSGEDGGQTDREFSQKIIDAKAGTSYLNLDTGETVAIDGDWHLALNRTNIQLNSGASGDGNVVGALGDAQASFYTDSGEADANQFLNASPDGELDHLKDTFTAPETWVPDGVVYALGDDWSEYGAGGVIAEAPGVGYLVRSNTGDSYARMRILDFNFPTREIDENNQPKGIKGFTIEFQVQAAGTTQLSDTTLTFSRSRPENYDGGDSCFDFDSNSIVDCATSDAWDVQIGYSGREWYVKTNSGPSGSGNGGALGPIPWSELSAYPSATIDSSGESLARAYSADATGGLFSENSWYEYNLQGAHKLWPNFRVYLIDSNSSDPSAPAYAMQVINYYGADGVSGQPEIRWKEVTLESEAN